MNLPGISPRAQSALFAEALQRAKTRAAASGQSTIWSPQAGPQTAAYFSAADITGYGGHPGGGKTDLLLGLAGTQHRQSIVYRRVFPSVRGIIERSREIYNAIGINHSQDSYNESLHIWRLASGRMIEFASMQYEKDKTNFQGRPHDLYGFDELTEFTESQFRFVIGWNRSTYVDPVTKQPQRCRVVVTFNPPLDETGEWVTRYFAPWFDERHPHPAQDGELRWYAMIDEREQEVNEADLVWYAFGDGDEQPVASGDPIPGKNGYIIPVRALIHQGKPALARSRTFFHATLKDNPILEATGYAATIDTLPEPIRSIMKGLKVARPADPWQTIPTEWVLLAQQRWVETPKPGVVLRSVGNDVAHGGADNTVFAPIYGTWFDELTVYPGTATPRGEDVAARAQQLAGPGIPIYVDAIGYGAAAFEAMQQWGLHAFAVNFGAGSEATDKSRRFRFANIRAEAYWRLREALDPASGENICLPPDREMMADLCAPKFKVVAGRIQIEPKADIKDRIGRSPDKGDAVVLAWYGAVYGSVPLLSTVSDRPPAPDFDSEADLRRIEQETFARFLNDEREDDSWMR
jgi:hypothetical protein